MKLGFFTVFRRDPRHYLLARRMILSAQHVMPHVEVVQFTDENSPLVPGADRAIRKPHGPMLERRMEHYAEALGEWMLVDTDVIVQRDVCAVFKQSFDVALTDRKWPHVQQPESFMLEMPFNTGVVFSRSPAFWHAVLQTWRAFTPEQRKDWLSEQRAVAEVVRRDAFTVCVLPGMVYNYPPTTETDVGLKDAAIVHLKGARKDLRIGAFA